MNYYKNTELAKLYLVSDKTVSNWVSAAQRGKIALQLHEHNGKFYIANTTQNLEIIEEMVERNKKYKNTRGYKVIKPSPELYRRYSRRQVLDIISNLDVHREIPLQYSYFHESAKSWDKYANRLVREETTNLLNCSTTLLSSDFQNIMRLTEGATKINVVDLGVGNAMPVRGLIEQLIEKNLMGSYIGIDISASMLEVAKNNLISWFGNRVPIETYVRDFSYERFGELAAEHQSSPDTINLVLMMGGTLENFRAVDEVLQTVYNSLRRNDLFIVSEKLDTDVARRYFDFDADSKPKLATYHRYAFDLLNIDESLYDVEQYYDQERSAREIRIRLKVALTLQFELGGFEAKLDLHKGETILLWRYWHRTGMGVIEELHKVGFEPLQVSTTKDRQFIMTIASVAVDRR